MQRRETPLPLALPQIGEEEIEEVVACLRSGWITTGPRARKLEEAFAAHVGASHAVALSSCTAAIHVALLALGIGPGDEVICPPLTWPSTANMVLATGATVRFADIDPATWNLAPEAIAAALTDRTRAVLPVHYAGMPVDLDAIAAALERAGRSDVAVLEDAAHAAGAQYRGRPIGADANPSRGACFSFHPIKNMTTVEGGMLVTDDAELAERARLWRFHGVRRDAFAAYSGAAQIPTGYDVTLPGFKYNLSDLHAAVGLHQLRKLDAMNARRAELAARYEQRFAACGLDLERPRPAPYPHRHAWHLMAVLAPVAPEQRGDLEAGRRARARLMLGLHERGIGTGIHFEAVHLTSAYRERLGTGPGLCPVAEDVCSRVLSLPLFPDMRDEDVDDVVAALGELVA